MRLPGDTQSIKILTRGESSPKPWDHVMCSLPAISGDRWVDKTEDTHVSGPGRIGSTIPQLIMSRAHSCREESYKLRALCRAGRAIAALQRISYANTIHSFSEPFASRIHSTICVPKMLDILRRVFDHYEYMYRAYVRICLCYNSAIPAIKECMTSV